jgi:hypothetical protein
MEQGRIKRIEDALQPIGPGGEFITIDVCTVDTFIDEAGEKHEVREPATYDENIEFRDLGNGQFLRVRYPLEDAKVDPSAAND